MPYLGRVPAAVPVTADDIPNNSIDASKLVDGSITIADIADDAVTADKLANSINSAIAANTAKTGITSGQASAITANTAKVTNYNQTKTDIDALGIAASSITGALPAISGASLTGLTSSQMPTGSVLQVAHTNPGTGENYWTNSATWHSVGTIAITPNSTSNKVFLLASCPGVWLGANTSHTSFRIMRGATQVAYSRYICSNSYVSSSSWFVANLLMNHMDTPSTTSSTTYSMEIKTDATGAVYAPNGEGEFTITAMEVQG